MATMFCAFGGRNSQKTRKSPWKIRYNVAGHPKTGQKRCGEGKKDDIAVSTSCISKLKFVLFPRQHISRSRRPQPQPKLFITDGASAILLAPIAVLVGSCRFHHSKITPMLMTV